jgi:hypothetical protein
MALVFGEGPGWGYLEAFNDDFHSGNWASRIELSEAKSDDD